MKINSYLARLINGSYATYYVSGLTVGVDIINLGKFLAFILVLAEHLVVSIEKNNF